MNLPRLHPDAAFPPVHLWHRSRQNLPPRPVLIVQQLGKKARVLDLVDSTLRKLVFREVYPENLTESRGRYPAVRVN